MSINLSSITKKKQSAEYKSQICESLVQYPAKDSPFFLLIPAFVAMAESNPRPILTKLFEYFPPVFAPDSNTSRNEQDILCFLPKLVPGSDSPINFVVGYVSEAIFTTMVEYLVEKWQTIEHELSELLLGRLLQRGAVAPPEDSLQYRMLCLSVERWSDIIRFLCRVDFPSVSKILSAEFPTKKDLTLPAVLYFRTNPQTQGLFFGQTHPSSSRA
jgi:hypothetical protein